MNKHKLYTQHELSQLKAHYFERGPLGFPSIIKRHGYQSVCTTARRLGLTKIGRILNTENMSHFKIIKDPFVAYVLGFLWADGYIREAGNVIVLGINEEDGLSLENIILSTAKSWYSRAFTGEHERTMGKRYMTFAMSSQELKQWLLDNDYHVKSYCTPTKILSHVPDHLKHYWWRGYFDGDGCFYHSPRGHLGKPSRSMMQISGPIDQDWSVAEVLFDTLNISYKIRQNKRKSGGTSSINLETDPAIEGFAAYIYQGKPFGLQRKRDKYDLFLLHRKEIDKRKTSQYRGVFWDKQRKKWKMQICKDGKLQVAYYDDAKKAALEYNRLATLLHGRYAKLNDI